MADTFAFALDVAVMAGFVLVHIVAIFCNKE